MLILDKNLILVVGYVQVDGSDATRPYEEVLQEVQHPGEKEGGVLQQGGKPADVSPLDQGSRQMPAAFGSQHNCYTSV